MADIDPDELVLDLASEKCLPAVENLVSDVEMDDKKVVLVLKVFSNACKCTTVGSFAINLLSHLPKSTYMNFHLSSYINRMVSDSSHNIEETQNQLRMMIGLFTELLNRLPSCYADLPIAQLHYAILELNRKEKPFDGTILLSIEALATLKDEKEGKVKQEDEAWKSRQKRRHRQNEAALHDIDVPPDDFRNLSVVPTHHDVHCRERPFLRRNKVDGSYDSPEHYLDVQFRLLREDFVRPLRDGILQMTSSTKTGPLQDIRVYHNVRILSQEFTSKALTHKLSFDVSMIKINWENSKRLIYGSLLCLSKDNFDNFMLATVENRELKEGRLEVGVRFSDTSLNLVRDNNVYKVVETTAYFEAYRHVLEGLKEIHADSIPFQRYIVECSRDTQPPAYLRNRLREVVTYDLTPIMKNTSGRDPEGRSRKFSENRDGKAIEILNMNSWPSAEDLQLDDSQLKALQLALTSEFALIQGPPGTGKTYIGLKVVKILLHNKDKWMTGTENVLGLNHDDDIGGPPDRRAQHNRRNTNPHPILVVCYTNHALDQFLEGIHEFHPHGIVRIGGRSQSETMKRYSLTELRKLNGQRKVCYKTTQDKLNLIKEQMEDAAKNIQHCKEMLVHDNVLVNKGYMTGQQYNELTLHPGLSQSEEPKVHYWLGLMNDESNLLGTDDMNITREEEQQEELDNDTLFEAKAEEERRMLDDDEVTDFRQKKEKSIKSLMNAHPLENMNQKMRIRELDQDDMMTSQQAAQVNGIWELSMRDRWRLYRYWIDQLCEENMRTIESYRDAYEQYVNKLSEIQSLEDLHILEGATVIGMTTTGAAKYRSLIQKIKPRITIVEEAAEVLESHIVTSLTPECQHLILIGDHQQLRPNPTVYDLAKNYHLDMSLFERMVNIGMRLETLNSQHRMRPEIAEMMSHIYKDLQNHESVMNFTDIQGVDSNIFFIEHNELEDFVEEGRSRSNIHEAKYLVALCQYLILQGYKPQKITILTMYTGQLIKLKKEMLSDFFSGVRICTVDNFQGEENDIILLSLVRSNEKGKIGFLRTSNRVCVALSRAKQGFYCIGNIHLICQKEKLWNDIIEEMRRKGKVGQYLTLTCKNHPQNVIHASCPDDFKNAPEGGCMEPCAARLDCGHVCKRFCHPEDPEHKNYKCSERCTRMLCEDHECEKLCWEDCGKCTVLVSKEIPGCQHIQQLPCYKDPKEFNCLVPCLIMMNCGQHHCQKPCFEKHDTICRIMVKKILKCGHETTVECHMNPEEITCSVPCNELLTCGHPCQGTCGACLQGHCHLPCKVKCERTLLCGHKCPNQCFEKCDTMCTTMVKKSLKCGHETTTQCHVDPEQITCSVPCKELLTCGHPCQGSCGRCSQGHIPCKAKCERLLLCGHHCLNQCFENCETKCMAKVKKSMKCGHETRVQCHMDPKEVTCSFRCGEILNCGHPCKGMCKNCSQDRRHLPCKAKCERLLLCGHHCLNQCFEDCDTMCRTIVKKLLKCGHETRVQCHMDPEEVTCNVPCAELLTCGHPCKGTCRECFQGRLHLPCKEKCERLLLCGHLCKQACSENCPPCKEPCQNKCAHRECKKMCGEPCIPCKMPCKWKCKHYQCSRRCGEPCDRPRCKRACSKRLTCGHRCIGICGEPCPKKCRVCNKDEVTEIFFGDENKPTARFVELHPCSHVIEVNAMDHYMDEADDDDSSIKLKGCPRCQRPILTARRYGDIIKTSLADIEQVKAKLIVPDHNLRMKCQRRKMEPQTFNKRLRERDELRRINNMKENRINFLCFLKKVISSAATDRKAGDKKKSPLKRGMLYEIGELTKVLAEPLRERIMMPRLWFSYQEKEEINDELLRFSLVTSYNVMVRLARYVPRDFTDKLEHISQAIDSANRISKDDRDRYMKDINELAVRYDLDLLYQPVTDPKKNMIVNAMAMVQGHWLKCPKGHIYCIGECAGAMEEAKCPECRCAIGATNHKKIR